MVIVRVRFRAGVRECISCTYFPLLCKCTYGYSIDDVTAWSWVNLATP